MRQSARLCVAACISLPCAGFRWRVPASSSDRHHQPPAPAFPAHSPTAAGLSEQCGLAGGGKGEGKARGFVLCLADNGPSREGGLAGTGGGWRPAEPPQRRLALPLLRFSGFVSFFTA